MTEIDFQLLGAQYYLPLYRFGLSLTHQQSEAADLTQHTFHTWALKGHQLRDPTKAKTWLFTTLYRKFLAEKRYADRFVGSETELLFVEPSPFPPAMANVLDAGTVLRELHTLDERFRAPVTLFYLQQHSYREIAEILEIPIGTVMSRIHRGKAELRARLVGADPAMRPKAIPPAKEAGYG